MHIANFEPQRMEERRVLFIPPLLLCFFAIKFQKRIFAGSFHRVCSVKPTLFHSHSLSS